MRLLIYLLAMLTGFSAAEAARPVAALPASVDAAVGRVYAAAAVKVAEQVQARPVPDAAFRAMPTVELLFVDAFPAILSTTPVLRHDVILG